MKVLVKLIVIAIVLTLSCSKSYCLNDTTFLRGVEEDSIKIPVEYIKVANKKLIELKYLKQELALRDSIIILTNEKYDALDVEVSELQTKLDRVNKVNEELNDELLRATLKNKFTSGCAAVGIAATIFLILFK